jgi:hypothetical protein
LPCSIQESRFPIIKQRKNKNKRAKMMEKIPVSQEKNPAKMN